MKPPVENVRISPRAKEILIRVKSRTGIDQWNILCRWALCTSLQAPGPPPQIENLHDSNVEMAWKTFAGAISDSLCAIVKIRAQLDGIEPDDHESIARTFRLHLERGITKLQATKSLDDLVNWTRPGT